MSWTRELVDQHGWLYEVWSEPPVQELDNLRFLAGFRNAARFDADLLKTILQECVSDTTVGQVLDRHLGEAPLRVRAAVLHLLWCRDLAVDITVPLTRSSPLLKGKGHV